MQDRFDFIDRLGDKLNADDIATVFIYVEYRIPRAPVTIQRNPTYRFLPARCLNSASAIAASMHWGAAGAPISYGFTERCTSGYLL